MSKPTIKLQRSLVRLLKGMLAAWDEWLDEQDREKLVEKKQ